MAFGLLVIVGEDRLKGPCGFMVLLVYICITWTGNIEVLLAYVGTFESIYNNAQYTNFLRAISGTDRVDTDPLDS